MYHSKKLKKLMSQDLPSLTYQRKLSYKANVREVKKLYKLINAAIFNNRLVMPRIKVKSRLMGSWGECLGVDQEFQKNRSRCMIIMNKRWYCKQWLIMSLAHEMVHQYQWDIISKRRRSQGLDNIMSHGPTFFQWRNKFARHKIPLKTYSGSDKWFATQHLFKC